jgi:hypothetical protein
MRGMLESRYDELKSGRVKPIDGEQAFARLREKAKTAVHERPHRSHISAPPVQTGRDYLIVYAANEKPCGLSLLSMDAAAPGS